MKSLIIIFLLASSSLMAQTSKEQKYYRVVQFYKTENRMIYYNWSLDSAATYNTVTGNYGTGAILKVETKMMTTKEADKANKRNENKKKRANYQHI